MIITELTSIEYLEFIKNVFRDNNFRFLLLSIARYGDNKRFFNELEEYWASIENVTGNKIVFLNFTSNIIEPKTDDMVVGSRKYIFPKGIQTIKKYDLKILYEKASGADLYKVLEKDYEDNKHNLKSYFWGKYTESLQDYHNKWCGTGDLIGLEHLPKLRDKLNQTIDESATQLLEYLGKKESDAPFLYLLDLRNNKEYFFSLNDIYAEYNSLYDFIKTLTIKIEEEFNLEIDSRKCDLEIDRVKSLINKKRRRLEKKQQQLDYIPTELLEVGKCLKEQSFNSEQRFYLESIINRKKYELTVPIKNLFPRIFINGKHINEIINFYSSKDLNNLETNIKDWINTETENLESYLNETQVLIQELNNKISQNTAEINLLYINLTGKNHQSINRKMRNFTVALTYAGENRGYVEQVANNLEEKLGKGKVFYDRFFRAELARINLDIFLQDIYRNKSDFIVVFLSKDYETKEWCGLEWRSVRDLIKRKQSDKIILVKIEDFNLDGIFSIDGYLDGINNNPATISELISRRIFA